MDGNLDDAVWHGLPRGKGFLMVGGPGFAWRKPTSFRMGWTDDGLYVAVRCREPFRHRIHPLTADGDKLWSDESVELFLSVDGKDYCQFIFNTVGARWHGKGSQEGTKEQPVRDWTATAGKPGDDWTAEVWIPFSVVGAKPQQGDVWTFNIGRNAVLSPAVERHSCWAPVRRGFADVSAFASLTFMGAPAAATLPAINQRLNDPFHAFCAKLRDGLTTPVKNRSFEDGLAHWGRREPRRTSIDEATATFGRCAIRLDGVLAPAEAPVHVAASQSVTLKPGTRYILRADIKRSKLTGHISVDVIERDAKNASWTYHRCGTHPGEGDVAGEWERHEIRFKTSDKLLQSQVMLYNIGSNAVAWYDNIELLEDDGSAGKSAVPRDVRNLVFELSVRNATATVRINGEAMAVTAGEPVSTAIREGFTVIAVEAEAEGETPGVKFTVRDHPETDGRWRVSGAPDTPAAWLTADYDDTGWDVATPDAGGYVWPGRGSKRSRMRQILLWNRTHHGPDRCILPLIKEWGISEGSVETVWKTVYSPFPFPLPDYEFVFDVPSCFRLLDFMHENGRHVLNTQPSGYRTERISHNGQDYTRYRIAFPEKRMYTGTKDIYSRYLLLPVFLKKWTGTGETTAWYCRRQAKGNFTELQQKIPVRILPPINGRMLKNVMISQFNAKPWRYSQISHEHLAQHCTQSFQAGFNTWVLSVRATRNTTNDPYLKAIHDRVVNEENGRMILWANYPYHGTKEPPFDAPQGTKQFLYKWMAEEPRARARYWEDSNTWETKGQWCPSYALGEGREAFHREVLANYRLRVSLLPGCSIVWSDFEEAPWAGASIYSTPKSGKGSWCFCDGCKETFRKWGDLPADADLADRNIFASYKKEWHDFRSQQDGDIAKVCKRAANELGREYMMYSWMAHRKFWQALRGNLDRAFPGSPGNGVADGYQQRALDRNATFLRDECGLARPLVMGQRFAFFNFYAWRREQDHREYWRKWTVLSPSGYIEPKTWKTQVLRVVAAHGGGVDLHSSIQCPGGMLYWIGEATRVMAEYEDLFHKGERADDLAACDSLAYPDVLVLRKGAERVVLLFNEGEKAMSVLLKNKDVLPGQAGAVYGTDLKTDTPAQMRVTVPAQDVAVVHLK
ncbi:MAG: hypothetical protein HN742_24045 [Lentisphaerae bacterium]|jgi:hypothetical protein|nr:hypothetical protein [Lentisphaerota bacterium]MBT7059570.1 hypothetical protein [Lentisphaerota bacterium]MBT7844970.1 hypothetical protein [Lentisphaerota bacterium]